MNKPLIYSCAARRRQRGTAYILVLAITTLLITLGITASQIARNQIERADNSYDQAKARVTAIYAQDVLHKRLTGDMSWRDGLSTGYWYSLGQQDGVNIIYAYIDQIDNDLDDDYSDPFTLYTAGVSGSSFRIYSVEYASDSDGNLTRLASTFKQEVFSK